MTLCTLIFSVFVASTLVQLYYFLKVFSAVAFHKHLSPPRPHTPPGVSVLICAHNELANLKKLLPALQKQRYQVFEVIVALDRSEDGSSQWLDQLNWGSLKVVTIHKVPHNLNSKKYALLNAIERARYPVLLLTDADCYPQSDRWIQTMADHFDPETDIVLGYSPYEKQPGWLNFLIRYETLLTAMQYLSRALDGHPYMGVGRNLAYRKSFFESNENLRPFMQVTGGDDDLFVNKYATAKNTKVCLQKESWMISIPKTKLSQYIGQKKRHLSVGKYYKMADKVLLGIFSLTHIIFWSSLVSLLVTATFPVIVVTLFLFRQIVLILIVNRTSHRLGDRFQFGVPPLLDFLYTLFYMYTGLVALISKKVNWH